MVRGVLRRIADVFWFVGFERLALNIMLSALDEPPQVGPKPVDGLMVKETRGEVFIYTDEAALAELKSPHDIHAWADVYAPVTNKCDVN